MAKRGYKLQEFVAHSANVNCVKIGKKTRRHFITGGDDEKVNLWSIGKPNSITSLSGHTSPIESVAFDSTEVLVAAGASSGVIKLWDLEETKVVRTLNGHRSYCTAVEFHPFGEFFASGSMDTNLKIWDIRKKGCIHTYKGHRRAISTIRFTPDGRWVVSGALDNVVKIWDLTAGKLLHEFKAHEGHIKSIDFHPLEFLLATGSSDRTVKFWDLETFELIGSTRPEATGVRSITFHPDGRTLFCGLDGSLKVYSWEPVICHDGVDMGWSTLSDLCIDDGKLLGCSYYQNSVGVWVADVSHIKPYGQSGVAEENIFMEPKTDLQERLLERVGSPRRSSISPDDDTKDIKNIYVDTAGVTSVASRKSGSSPKVVDLPNSEESRNLVNHKQSAAKTVEQANDNSFVVPNVLLNDDCVSKSAGKPRRESIASGPGITGVSLKQSHRRRPSSTRLDVEGLSVAVEPEVKNGLDTAASMDFRRRLLVDDAAKDSSEERTPTNSSVVKDIQKAPSPRTLPNQENGDGSVYSKQGLKPVKYVNGVAVVHGRTRSLVEKFEKREKLNADESETPDIAAEILSDTDKTPVPMVEEKRNVVPSAVPEAETSPTLLKTHAEVPSAVPEAETSLTLVKTHAGVPCAVPEAEAKTSRLRVKTPDVVPCAVRAAKTSQMPVDTPAVVPCPLPEAMTLPKAVKAPDVVSTVTEAKTSQILAETPDSGTNKMCEEPSSSPVLVVQRPKTSPSILPEKAKALPMQRSAISRRVVPERVRSSPVLVARRSSASSHVIPERTKTSPVLVATRHSISAQVRFDKAKSSSLLDDSPQTTGRGLTSKSDDEVDEDLMLNHDVFLSTLRSRLTKLQVVRHFWERNDMKGAINALRKLPDHAVQADVVSVLMEKMETVTLDLFSCLLPVLLGLLDSNTERHLGVSLEMLLKLVAVFGSLISSTISAPPAVGVDLHAEKRLECCNECNVQLLKIQKSLPAIIRRGGLPARCAQELNLILQQS